LLILWGHATRYAFGFDGKDALTFPELGAALKSEIMPSRKGPTDRRPLDILGFDACGTSTIEAAYQLRDRATYMVASEIGVPLPGWPYSRILATITSQTSPDKLGKTIVREYVQSFPNNTVALTMLNLPLVEAIVSPLEDLARSLAIAIGTDQTQLDRVLSLFRRSAVPTGEPNVDLREVCINLGENGIDNTVQLAAAAMLPWLAEGAGPVAAHGRSGDGTTDLCGVCAYAPHVGRPEDSWLAMYDQLALSRRKTFWAEVVRFLGDAD